MFFKIFIWLFLAMMGAGVCGSVSAQSLSYISYSSLLKQAIAKDQEVVAWSKRAQASKTAAVNQRQWADPQLSFSLANLPTQGSLFGQEAMTQVRFGVQQALPQGDSLDIQQAIILLEQQQADAKAWLRQKHIARDLAEHYLDWYLTEISQDYIQQNLAIVTQWVGVLSAHYGSGKHQLQDVIAAQVEQSRLQLLLTELEGQKQALMAGFGQWYIDVATLDLKPIEQQSDKTKITLPKFTLPFANLKLQGAEKSAEQGAEKSAENGAENGAEQAAVLTRLQAHPQLQLARLEVEVANQMTEQAKQALATKFSLNASVGVRTEDRFGVDRADLFSVGLNMTQPLFGGAKQNDQITAAELRAQSKQADQKQQLQQMLTEYRTLMAKIAAWKQQHQLYQSQLLMQLEQQQELSLAAYNNDSGEFAQLLDAYVALMNGRIDMAKIEVMLLKLTSQVHYLVGV